MVFSKGREVILEPNDCIILAESDFTENIHDFKIMVEGSRKALCNERHSICPAGDQVLVKPSWPYHLLRDAEFKPRDVEFNDSPNCKALPSTPNVDSDKYLPFQG